MDEEQLDEQTTGPRSAFDAAHETGRLLSGLTRSGLCPGGRWLATASGAVLQLVDVVTGSVVQKTELLGDDHIACLAVRPVTEASGAVDVFVATSALEMKHYRTSVTPGATELECVRSWRGHTMPVGAMVYDSTGTVAACGCTDGRVLVYDVAHGYPTHVLQHSGLITALAFHPDPHRLMLVSASQNSSLRVWNLGTSASRELKGHLGSVADICFTPNGQLVSAGRDKTLIAWDVEAYRARATTVLYEELTSVTPLIRHQSEEKGELEQELTKAGVEKSEELVLVGSSTNVLRVVRAVNGGAAVVERSGLGDGRGTRELKGRADGSVILVTEVSLLLFSC